MKKSLKRGGAQIKRKTTRKRKLNAFFKAMLKAKSTKQKFFMYKGRKYVGKMHKHLGMVYKKE